MQCTGLLPGCYSSKDVNAGTNGGAWPIFNDCLPLPTEDQFLHYDNKLLRQKMLQHESIFRYQVHELHRLYRRQMELMVEIKSTELSKENKTFRTSQSNSFWSKVSMEPAQKTSNPAARRLSAANAENLHSTSSCFEWNSTEAGPCVETEDQSKDYKLSHPKFDKPRKKMLDLELPADEFIDSVKQDWFREENVSKNLEVPCYPPKKMPDVSVKTDLELFSHSCLRNSIFQGGSSLPRHDVGDVGHNFNTVSQVSSLGNLHMPFKRPVELPAECFTYNLLDKCNMKLQIEGTNFVTKTSERNHDLSNDACRGQASSCLPALYQHFPRSDWEKSEPSSAAFWKELTHYARQNSTAVQALPCFNIVLPSIKNTKSAVASSFQNRNSFRCGRNSRSGPGVESLISLGNSFCVDSQPTMTEACSPIIGFNHLDCISASGSPSEIYSNCIQHSRGRDVNASNALDLNILPSCLLDSEVSQKNVGTDVKKHEEPQAFFCGPGGKPDCSNKLNEKREDLPQIHLGFSPAFSTVDRDTEPKRFKTSNCLGGSDKFLGRSNSEKPQDSSDQFSALASSSSSPRDASDDKDIASIPDAGLPGDKLASCSALNSRKQWINEAVSLNIIDLNSCPSKEESSPALFIPWVAIKRVAEIDLEAPVSPENKECSRPRGESEENRLETTVTISKQGNGDQRDELVTMAAEAIVWISTPGHRNTLCESLEAPSSDSLHWLAEVVSVMAGDLDNEVGMSLSGIDYGDRLELSSNKSSCFEPVALELTDTKEEKYCCKSNGQKEEETGAVLSNSRPRRGRTRKGRWQEDFHGTKNTVWSPLKLRNNESGFEFGEKILIGWGKTNRRRREPRIPASNPFLFFK